MNFFQVTPSICLFNHLIPSRHPYSVVVPACSRYFLVPLFPLLRRWFVHCICCFPFSEYLFYLFWDCSSISESLLLFWHYFFYRFLNVLYERVAGTLPRRACLCQLQLLGFDRDRYGSRFRLVFSSFYTYKSDSQILVKAPPRLTIHDRIIFPSEKTSLFSRFPLSYDTKKSMVELRAKSMFRRPQRTLTFFVIAFDLFDTQLQSSFLGLLVFSTWCFPFPNRWRCRLAFGHCSPTFFALA